MISLLDGFLLFIVRLVFSSFGRGFVKVVLHSVRSVFFILIHAWEYFFLSSCCLTARACDVRALYFRRMRQGFCICFLCSLDACEDFVSKFCARNERVRFPFSYATCFQHRDLSIAFHNKVFLLTPSFYAPLKIMPNSSEDHVRVPFSSHTGWFFGHSWGFLSKKPVISTQTSEIFPLQSRLGFRVYPLAPASISWFFFEFSWGFTSRPFVLVT